MRFLVYGYCAILSCTMSVFFNPVEAESILLQSTTSTKNSGLYDHLLPRFSSDTGITVNVVAVGTGQALRNARNGDADVLLVHAREAEEAFVRDGFGVERFDLMYNDFVIVGPRADPADIRNSTNAGTALQKISASGSLFTSRGDDSGTHKKERMLWQQSGIDVDIHSGSWYRETGSGMGATLNIAIGLGAYALTDRATWISFENKHDFTIHVEGDQRLHNQYGVILVNPDKHLHVKQAAAQTFIDWLLSSAGQSSIAGYKLDGEQLFFPNASR